MKFPEHLRVQHTMLPRTNPGDPFGFFVIPPSVSHGRELKCVVSDGDNTGWEHVSVSLYKTRPNNPVTPNWYEMCAVKSLFWEDTETVVQLHVPASCHINVHSGVLHLWRKKDFEFPLPPSICV